MRERTVFRSSASTSAQPSRSPGSSIIWTTMECTEETFLALPSLLLSPFWKCQRCKLDGGSSSSLRRPWHFKIELSRIAARFANSRERAGSNLGNPKFPFFNLHFAFLTSGRTLGIVNAKPAAQYDHCVVTIFFLLHQSMNTVLFHLLSAILLLTALKLIPRDNAAWVFAWTLSLTFHRCCVQ